MANWTTRKTKTTKISKNASFKSSQTFTYGKGITNSQSFGNKAGRTTISTGPKGTKMYNTVRSGDMHMRTSKTLSSNKTRRPRKLRIRKGDSSSLIVFLILAIVVFLIMM